MCKQAYIAESLKWNKNITAECFDMFLEEMVSCFLEET
jgi:hypothetical protein